MTFCVVTAPCHDCKYTDCVTVGPVDCFYQDDMMLYIDPKECIDCGACVPECPVNAIYSVRDVPARWEGYIQLNPERVQTLKGCGGNITTRLPPQEGPDCK